MMTLKVTTLGQRIMQRFKYETPWTFSTSSGVSGSIGFWGLGGASLYMANTSSGEKGTLRCVNTGLSLGLLPVSGEGSTADMWSKGSLRSSQSTLSFDDLKGPFCVLSGALGDTTRQVDGLSGSCFFLGFPSGLPLFSGAIEMILGGLLTARAVGMLAGKFKGADAGISLMAGYATSIALLDRIFS